MFIEVGLENGDGQEAGKVTHAGDRGGNGYRSTKGVLRSASEARDKSLERCCNVAPFSQPISRAHAAPSVRPHNEAKLRPQKIQSSRTGPGAKGRGNDADCHPAHLTWIGAQGAGFRTGYRDFA